MSHLKIFSFCGNARRLGEERSFKYGTKPHVFSITQLCLVRLCLNNSKERSRSNELIATQVVKIFPTFYVSQIFTIGFTVKTCHLALIWATLFLRFFFQYGNKKIKSTSCICVSEITNQFDTHTYISENNSRITKLQNALARTRDKWFHALKVTNCTLKGDSKKPDRFLSVYIWII
jgi:hypothetical protein